jgi:hypothetical protein
MVSKSINNIMERVDGLQERIEPVVNLAQRVERIEENQAIIIEKLNWLIGDAGSSAAEQAVDNLSRASETKAHKLDAGKRG